MAQYNLVLNTTELVLVQLYQDQDMTNWNRYLMSSCEQSVQITG